VAARRHLELDYTGSDISAGALELARSAVPGEFVVGDAAEVAAGWAPASADVIVMKNLLHHLARPAVLLDHARRALAPGGRVVAVEVSRGSPWAWTFNLLAPRRERYFFVAGTARNRNAFTAAGLRVVAEDRFSLLPYELLFAIKYPVFRRLLPWTGATVDRVADVDQRLTRRAPALASYIIWVGEPAESSGGPSMAGEGALGTSRA
jgi:SAM-dependent methyltransferase